MSTSLGWFNSRSSSSTSSEFPAGFKTLYTPPDDCVPVVDIIFIHGLTGDRERTWRAEGAASSWPESLLPAKTPTARILTFGYDAYLVRMSESVSTNRIGNHSTNFLNAIARERHGIERPDRPIIFVCHSLGGLVCKDALVSAAQSPEDHLQNVLHSTRAIFFLGTPHNGSDWATWAKRMARVTPLRPTNADIAAVLEPSSEVLERIRHSFHTLLRSKLNSPPIEILCFYEELPLSPLKECVVPRASAIIDGYTNIGIRSDHRDIARFESQNNDGFRAISGELCRCIESNAYSHKGLQIDDREQNGNLLQRLGRQLGQKGRSRTPGLLHQLRGHLDEVKAIAFSPDGLKIASASTDKKLRLWNTDSGTEAFVLDGHQGAIVAVAFFPNDGAKLVSGSADKTMRVWNVMTRSEIRVLDGMVSGITSLALSPDGRYIAASMNRTIKLWNADTGEQINQFDELGGLVRTTTFGVGGISVISGGDDKIVSLRSIHSEGGFQSLPTYYSRINALACAPETGDLAVGSQDMKVRIYHSEAVETALDGRRVDGMPPLVLSGHNQPVTSVAFSPDGQMIVSGSSDGKVMLWSVESGDVSKELRAHKNPVTSVAFSPDGKVIASASADMTIKLWNVEDL